ncbi:MAG TPA: hypothetical protein VEK33_00280 [Terriglobales bacterium]|nr:hypothetical protein [Terriglobales bacterium]
MPFARTQNGVRIHDEVWGVESLPLVLLHGWGGPARCEMVSHLDSPGLQVIAPSYRGHGKFGQGCERIY